MKRIRPALWAYFALSALCLVLLPLFSLSQTFSEWFTRFIAGPVRLVLGGVSRLFPFSLFEVLIGLYALFVLALLILLPLSLIRKKRGKGALRLGALFAAALLVLLGVVDLFALTFASSYHRESLANLMALPVEQVDEESVFLALESLVKAVNESAPQLSRGEGGESLGPGLVIAKKKVKRACDAYAEGHSFLQKSGYPVKTFLVSPLMTYTHISGVFGFFTGEANVNTNYPHFVVTASSAHESCHARGIAPENECNFLASVILMESGDPYLVYCGSAALLEQVIGPARKIDRERANAILREMDNVFWLDLAAYRAFFAPYQDSTASKVADAGNDAYLKAQGQKEGVVSYSRVLSLTGAYFTKLALEKSEGLG